MEEVTSPHIILMPDLRTPAHCGSGGEDATAAASPARFADLLWAAETGFRQQGAPHDTTTAPTRTAAGMQGCSASPQDPRKWTAFQRTCAQQCALRLSHDLGGKLVWSIYNDKHVVGAHPSANVCLVILLAGCTLAMFTSKLRAGTVFWELQSGDTQVDSNGRCYFGANHVEDVLQEEAEAEDWAMNDDDDDDDDDDDIVSIQALHTLHRGKIPIRAGVVMPLLNDPMPLSIRLNRRQLAYPDEVDIELGLHSEILDDVLCLAECFETLLSHINRPKVLTVDSTDSGNAMKRP